MARKTVGRPTRQPKAVKGRSKSSARAASSNVIDLKSVRESASIFGRNFLHRLLSAQSLTFYQLAGVVVFMASFGIVMVLSSSYIDSLRASDNSFAIFEKQIIAGVLGLVAFALVSLVPASSFRRRAIPILAGSMLVQLATTLTALGVSINGNKNWINVLGFTVQPSEFLKLAMIIAMGAYLEARQNEFYDPVVWWKSLIIPGLAILAVFSGKDLGTAIIMAVIMIVILALAGLPRRILFTVFSVGAVLFIIALNVSSSRIGRIMAWINPNAPDPNDYNWQSQHGIWALAAGGFGGVGLGNSKLKWSWIPEAENDFIFAIIGEEEGLIGAVAVIALFIFMGWLFKRIAERTVDLYSRSVVIGVGIWILGQAMVNIAVVLNLLPVLGVPLPLISAGGSSLAANLLAIGVVLSIERENQARADNPALFRASRSGSARRKPVASKR